MTARAAGVLLLAVASCSEPSDPAAAVVGPPDLETAAIARGLVIDPATVELAGLYARGDDRICIVKGPDRTRIGAFVDYGRDQRCSASGTVEQDGGTLRVRLGEGCMFEARYDGVRIAFPGALPQACAASCEARASFEGMRVQRLSNSPSEAAALRDPDGRLLCSEGD